jgi:single-strand DNA-binding protein
MARRTSTTSPAEAQSPAPQETAPVATPVVLQGRLCRDPELRTTKTGIPVTTMRLAVNGPDGDTTFHDVIVFRRQAEVICQYLKKGRLVEVSSNDAPHERTWIGRDGEERSTSELVAYRVEFLSSRTGVRAAGREREGRRVTALSATSTRLATASDEDGPSGKRDRLLEAKQHIQRMIATIPSHRGREGRRRGRRRSCRPVAATPR